MKSQAARWKEGEGPALAEEVISRLGRGVALDGTGVGLHEGRTDLRGLTGRVDATSVIRGVTLQGLDLSGAVLSHLRFRDCRIVDCRFERARLDDLRIWGTEFAACDFSRAALPGITLGSGTDYASANVWRSVNFTSASFRGAGAKQVILEDVDFSNARLDGVVFRQCAMNRVTFAGRLRDTGFDGREVRDAPASPPFRNIDMRDAVLDLCDFWGCEFVDSAFPGDEEVIPVHRFPEVAERALRALAGDSSLAAGDVRSFLGHCLHGPAQSADSVFLLNLRDLRDLPAGEGTVRLARHLLLSAEA